MNEKHLPPKEKIIEAFSAVVSDRLKLENFSAEVVSSDNKRKYKVVWNDKNEFSSNDNATFWHGYIGYPIIAVLMKKGILTYDEKTALLFKNVNWNAVNKQFKRDYEQALKFVMGTLNLHNQQEIDVYEEIDKIYKYLKNLDIIIKRKI